MTGLTVSVVIVSRHRPVDLARCLAGLRQSDHPGFEVVVVADPAGLACAGPGVKTVAFDQANISVARNLGLEAAAGDVVAYLDDDAVPEPTWLTRLVAPFSNSDVAAAAGYVRGRDGITLEWQAQVMDVRGRVAPLAADPVAVSIHQGSPGRAVVTIGTNMAFRRDVLARLGGFDPAYRYFLDESDVNMRLAAAGLRTAIVPLAQVQHASAASERRRSDRAPISLHELGASTAVFLRKYADAAEIGPALNALRIKHRNTALRRMVSGRIEPRDVGRLMMTLDQGIAQGMAGKIGVLPPLSAATEPYLPLKTGPKPGILVAGWAWNGTALRRLAKIRRRDETIVTLLALSPTGWPHRARFHPDGYWEQRGGVFGRSGAGKHVVWAGFRTRIRLECARIASVRPIGACGVAAKDGRDDNCPV